MSADPPAADGQAEPAAGPQLRSGLVRIGELGRRVGVRPETLRAWERRYALFDPDRTPGNYRLYSAEDEAKAHSMATLIAGGVSAAEAAKLARAAPATVGAGARAPAPARHPVPERLVAELLAALTAFDEAEANALLDSAFARFSLDEVLTGVVMPMLAKVGECWARGELTIAQEHFSSELVRGRLLSVARGWGGGAGPLAVLACAPGEQHDIGLVAFGLALRERAWRIAFFGANTPIATLAEAAKQLQPEAVVVVALEREWLEAVLEPLRKVSESHALMLGGEGAGETLASSIGAASLGRDLVGAANLLATATRPG